MELKAYRFKPDYNKNDSDIAEEFYLPAMRCAKKYDRISGYFGSTVYIIAWGALTEFVDRGGKMRIICSPVVSAVDKDAIMEGYSAREDDLLKKALLKELDELFATPYLTKPARVLACLIAEGIIEVKIAVPETGIEPDLERLFHDKVGIFMDDYGNSVGFRGSMNETFQGLSEDGNLESIDVFPSWSDQRDAVRLNNAIDYFERLWNEKVEHVYVYKFPEAVESKLIEESNGYDWKTLVKEISTNISVYRKWRPDKHKSNKLPRPHQIEALENWVKNNRRGILEHATGSGKTYTAICAIRDALNRHKSVLVVVPSKELLHQWKQEISNNIQDIEISYLLCGDGNNLWKSKDMLKVWTRQSDTMNKITIAIMDTACSEDFVKNVVAGNNLLLVADEVHRIGSPSRQNILCINAGERLGLSATPVRYGDPEGTEAIFDYFNGIVKPVFSLEDAIKAGVLTKYYYHPIQVHLSNQEQEDWNSLTRRINSIIAKALQNGGSIRKLITTNPFLQRQLIKRARIIKQAKHKVSLSLEIINKHFENGQKWIVYCDNQEQLGAVLRLLIENGYDAYEYHSAMQGDRTETLKYFATHGGILVSIRCLDEGVDIPATTHALILASSKNPREFIQRRGRILRNYPGKYFAQLYDAVVVPESSMDESDKSISIIANELARAIQFGTWAENPSCVSELKILAAKFGIDYESIKNGGYEEDGDTEES